MSAKIIDGKKCAQELQAEVLKKVVELKVFGIVPGLATMLVGENSASKIYLKNKHAACKEVGIDSFNYELRESSDTNDVLHKIKELNADPKVHAILIQLPLPHHVNAVAVLSAINPAKDVDGFHPENFGKLFAVKDFAEINQNKDFFPIPCTPQGILHLILRTGIAISKKNAVVIGRSTIVGKPTSALLLSHHATVTIAHSQTRNLAACSREADILVAAIGKAKMITAEFVKEDAVVIDVGINRDTNGKICGDVDFDSVKEKAGWISPVPGGVGPMTIAMLLKNTVSLAKEKSLYGN